MDQLLAALDASWRVLLAGIVLGAGLPALFSLGLRTLAWGTGTDAVDATDHVPAPQPAARVLAITIFVLVVLIVLAGLAYIVLNGLGIHLI